MRPLIGLLAIACFALQAVAISKASMAGITPVHCVVWPLGECGPVLASGYGHILGAQARKLNLDDVFALLVPLTMFYGIILSLHSPPFWMLRKGKRRLSPGAWGYITAYAVILALSFSRLTV